MWKKYQQNKIVIKFLEGIVVTRTAFGGLTAHGPVANFLYCSVYLQKYIKKMIERTQIYCNDKWYNLLAHPVEKYRYFPQPKHTTFNRITDAGHRPYVISVFDCYWLGLGGWTSSCVPSGNLNVCVVNFKERTSDSVTDDCRVTKYFEPESLGDVGVKTYVMKQRGYTVPARLQIDDLNTKTRHKFTIVTEQ